MPLTDYSSLYGIGKGNAQVFPSSPAVQLYGKLVQQEQAKREADQAALASKLANLNTNGLRDADKDQYYKAYDDWRTAEQQSYGLKGQDKFNAQANAQKLYQGLNGLVASSKAKTVRDAADTRMIMTNPYAINEEGIAKHSKSLNAPVGSADDITDYTPYQGYDTSKAIPIIDTIKKTIKDGAKTTTQVPIEGPTYKVGNKTLTPSHYEYAPDNEAYAGQIATAAMASKPVDAFLRAKYADLPWNTDYHGALAAASKAYTGDDPVLIPNKINTAVENFKDAAPDNFYAHWMFQLAHPKTPVAPTYSAPVSLNIPFADGTANVHTAQYVPISLPAKNFAGSPYIDMSTGQPSKDRLPSSNDYQVVGVTNIPVLNTSLTMGSRTVPKGSLAQPNFAKLRPNMVTQEPMVHVQYTETDDQGEKKQHDALIPYDRLPENVRNVKSVRDALAAFTPAGQKPASTSGKTVPASTIKGLVGTKGYEGYTEKELRDYYTSKGYTIK